MFLLLLHRGDGHASVIVSRVQLGRGWQSEYLVVHAVVKGFRAAFLEVGATAAPYQQGVPRERDTLQTSEVGLAVQAPGAGCGLGE